MQSLRTLMLTLIPVVAVGACTTLSDKDRATLTAASESAEQAKQQSAQALAAAQAAQASAAQAASEAKAADEKADRIFQRSLRK